MPIAPLCPEAPHLAALTLERLAAGLADNAGQSGDQLIVSRYHDVTIALQRLIGALGGEPAELQLIAMLGLPADYLFGDYARHIAHARSLGVADAAQPAQVQA
jgi:hypothetical protein